MVQKNRGFTLVELMITVVIVAIGVALAVPSWQALVEKRQLTAAMEEIASFITYAQSEAVKRNEQVTFSWYSAGSHSSNWCVGATLGEDACDCREADPEESDFCTMDAVHTADSPATKQSQADYVDMGSEFFHTNSNLTDDSFGFDPIRGILTDMSGDVLAEIAANDYLFYVHSNSGSGSSRLYAMELRVNLTGRVEICSDTGRERTIAGYRRC